MNTTAVTWIVIAVLIVLSALLMMVLPAQRAPDVSVPTPPVPVERPLAPATPLPTPAPTPLTLTPEQEQLTDLRAETEDLGVGEDVGADLESIDAELRGI